MKLTVEQVKELAMAHYVTGGDVIIECYTDEEIAAEITCTEDLQRIFTIRAEKAAALEYFRW